MVEIIDIESSAQFYRLISKESLHLRSGYGRDDALIRQLSKKLGLDPNKPIPKQLESNKTSLEEFIQEFFLLNEPFARMLDNIYTVMQRQNVQSSFKSIRMKFSFEKVRKQLDFDLKHFREWLTIYQKFRGDFYIRSWTQRDIDRLYQPIARLRNIFGESHDADTKRYYPSPLPEPPLFYVDDRWKPLRLLRDAMEQLRRIYTEEKDQHQTAAISVLTEKYEQIEPNQSENRLNLTDIWPGFVGLLLQLEQRFSSKNLTSEAIQSLEEIDLILSEVNRTRIKSQLLVRNFVKLLRLPFWKYRWQLYEVWILFELVECLEEYDSKIKSSAGRISLEEQKASKVAQFRDSNSLIYEVWTQLKTSVALPRKRRHIMPDIRLCKSDASLAENTFLIIECKQRIDMTATYLTDLVEDYRKGAEKSILFLFVNYDTFPAIPDTFSDVKLLSNVTPANPEIVTEFKNLIKIALNNYGIGPPTPQFDAIVFDVSESMHGKYLDQEVGNACKDLLARNPVSKVFSFSSHLLPIERLSISNLAYELETMVSGSTDLDGALRELAEKYPAAKRIAIVTDGEYDETTTARNLFEAVQELILKKNFPPKTK